MSSLGERWDWDPAGGSRRRLLTAPFVQQINQAELFPRKGRISQVIGLVIEAEGPQAKLGELCYLQPGRGKTACQAEVVGFREDRLLLMPLGEIDGIGPGAEVIATGIPLSVQVGDELLGRVIDGLGQPMDGQGPIRSGVFNPLVNTPPNPLTRGRIRDPLSTGVKTLDALLTVGNGQRMGVFAGSGVGKSTLLGMIARNTSAEVNVIGLIGERGREVREFLERDLGPEALRRSVVVVATSNQPALVRVKGAFTATAVAEYFRDRGRDVLLMMDSVTRFAMSQREVGLAVGEPPATRGYTPSVFALLPRLLERSGTSDLGTITALYTVLVEGDDMNEPVADAVRGILDGHVVLTRQLATRGLFPAIDVLQSVSRTMTDVVEQKHLLAAQRVKMLLATYTNAEELVNIGAYVRGSNPEIDLALTMYPRIREFLCQGVTESWPYAESVAMLHDLMMGV